MRVLLCNCRVIAGLLNVKGLEVGPDESRRLLCWLAPCPARGPGLSSLRSLAPRVTVWLCGCVAAPGCSLPCLMSWEQLEALCRREKVSCQQLGVNRANLNNYEVEFLCDYKKTKASLQKTRLVTTGHHWCLMVCRHEVIML